MRALDIAGQRFGRLTAIEPAPKAGRRRRWNCVCDCGASCAVVVEALRRGITKSCGCLRDEGRKTINLAGVRFGKLVAISLNPKSGIKRSWLCQCDCGSETTVRRDNLRSGHVRSCGCLVRDVTTAMGGRHRTHGQTAGGMSAEYRCWSNMRQRCYDPNNISFKNYGARGIVVCDRWRNSFENFLADVGFKPSAAHSIDRIDNDGNYEPGNCRWATGAEQIANRRALRRKAAA